MKVSIFLGILTVGIVMGPFSSVAGGSKRPADPKNPKEPSYSTPSPVRKAVLRPVGTQAFQLPNGARVDLAADLNAMLNTATTATETLSPTEYMGPPELCDTRIELRAAVSSLELNIAELGITVGYNPSGDLGGIVTGLNGSATVKLGTVAMDFSLWECVGLQCSSVAATTVTQMTSGVNLSFTVDFGVIETGPNFLYNTPLGGALRKIMMDGVKKLSQSTRLHELSWRATVREYHPELGILLFDRGDQDRLQTNQSFIVYAQSESNSFCDIYKPIAYIHTTQVDTISSYAMVDRTLDSRGVRVGDPVLIRSLK